jgi:hypothetical protein
MSDGELNQSSKDFEETAAARILRRFETEILPQAASRFAGSIENLRHKPAATFLAASSEVMESAFGGLLSMMELQAWDPLDLKIRLWAVLLTINYLNGFLPGDYPYILACDYAGNIAEIYYSAVPRHMIGGLHESCSKNIVPVRKSRKKAEEKLRFEVQDEIIIYDIHEFIRQERTSFFETEK